jgi:dihydrofolate reductase
MRISIISAMAENRVIGIENRLPWHLPADLKHFRSLTMGHHILMGRKTFESIGKPLPGRTTVIISRNPDFAAPGCIVAGSIEAAIAACHNDSEVFIIGGEQLYRQALPLADRLYLTQVATQVTGDAYFPEIDPAQWRQSAAERFPADAQNPYAYQFLVLEKAKT